ncbi:MAG: hypothetical protein LR015_09510 [Verrucomicrobia bacterium]|nr:hypothetical protein [Verrucomicrobiota bacterium]
MKTQLLTASIFLASYALSQATLLVSEPFNYTVGANIGAVAATGEGLTGNWQRSFTDTASAILRVDEKSNWSTPNGFGFTASPRIVRTNGDQNNSAAVNLASGAHINFAVDGIILLQLPSILWHG